MAASTSLKDYLKRYQSNDEEEDQKKKKRKKKTKAKPDAPGVLVVDQDPVWQKPVKLDDEEEDNDSPDEKPIVDEDIEVKRMRRLEMLRAKRALNAIAEDGSGWVSLSPKHINSADMSSDMSPPRKQRARNDTPSPEREGRVMVSGGIDADLSPPRQRQRRHHTPSPEPDTRSHRSTEPNLDLSPPRKQRSQSDAPLAEPELKALREVSDLSPPRRRRALNDTPPPQPKSKPSREVTDLSPPRQRRRHYSPSPEPGSDPSPSRQHKKCHYSPLPEPNTKPRQSRGGNWDLSPPRRRKARNDSPSPKASREDTNLSPPQQRQRPRYSPLPDPGLDLSPPRKRKKDQEMLHRHSTEDGVSSKSVDPDLSPPRKKSNDQKTKTGLISGRDIREEIDKTRKESILRFEQMDPAVSGRGAEAVYRDKKTGQRISKDEYLKTKQKIEEKPKEKNLEWGKGLAQKREAQARVQELELEKDKPFARSRDDPELDEMLKERVRWGDPMAHLVKKKHPGPAGLTDLGNSDKMKESGFIIPQDTPSHSWIRRGLDAAPNRYGIRPGRHWDGVDRSTGFEKQLFKRMNEKQATEREAYLWSVSDM